MGLAMACYCGLKGILSGLTKSTDHPSSTILGAQKLKQTKTYAIQQPGLLPRLLHETGAEDKMGPP